MDIDTRKENREKSQSENLLSIIKKEISPNVYIQEIEGKSVINLRRKPTGLPAG